MIRLLMLAVAVIATGCSNLVVVRGSSSDFLKKKAITVTLNAPVTAVQERLDQQMERHGFRPSATQAGEKASKIIIYKGPRRVPREAASYGVELGSWFAARIATDPQGATEVTLLGKPMVGAIELCSDHDKLLEDIKYTCVDTKVPPDWAGKNLVSGRDETEVVSDVLNNLYEHLKH